MVSLKKLFRGIFTVCASASLHVGILTLSWGAWVTQLGCLGDSVG